MTTETPQLNDHNKTEYPPMHNGEFDTSQTKTTLQHTLSMHYSVVIGCAAYL